MSLKCILITIFLSLFFVSVSGPAYCGICQTSSIQSYPAKISGAATKYCSTLQAAIDNAANGDTIQIRARGFTEDLVLSSPKTITLKGCYDQDFASIESDTAVFGTLTAVLGGIVLDNIVFQNDFIIDVSATSNGSISPSGTVINPGSSQSFTITPNTGYVVASVKIDGVEVDPYSLSRDGNTVSYTLTNLAGRHTISATFAVGADVSLTWDAPLTNTDGTPISYFEGEYLVYYGTSAGRYFETKYVKNPGGTVTSDVTDLIPGQLYYFAVTAINIGWHQSAYSTEIARTAQTSVTKSYASPSSVNPAPAADPGSIESNVMKIIAAAIAQEVENMATSENLVSAGERSQLLPDKTGCYDTASDVNNCGFCGNVCSAVSNGSVSCVQGECIYTCNAGYSDCSLKDVAKGARVIAASPTRPGNSLWNALDCGPDDNITIFSSPPPVSFTVGFGREVTIHAIELVWESGVSYATDYSIYDVDYSGNVFKTVKTASNQNGKFQRIRFETPFNSTYITIVVTGMSGPSVALRQLKVFAEQPTTFESLADCESAACNRIALESYDVANPLSVYGWPIIDKYALAADSILDGEHELTTHQKILKFMTFMNDFKFGISSADDPETVLRERITTDAGFANLLAALCASEGIPVRLVTGDNPEGYGYRENKSRVVVEFYVDGGWRMYDPTYAAFYTKGPSDISAPHVLSADELSTRLANNPDADILILTQFRYDFLPFSSLDIEPFLSEKSVLSGPDGH